MQTALSLLLSSRAERDHKKKLPCLRAFYALATYYTAIILGNILIVSRHP
jgi:hypothetical protein